MAKYVAKLCGKSNQVSVTIPVDLARQLGLEKGGYVEMGLNPSGNIELFPLELHRKKGVINAENKNVSD